MEIDDATFDVAHDFIGQLEQKADEKGMSQTDLAAALGVTTGRVSQIMNNPGNLTLNSMAKCALALGLRVSVIAYEDDKEDRSAVHPDIFKKCWEIAGKPRDTWSVEAAQNTHTINLYTTFTMVTFVLNRPVNIPAPTLTLWQSGVLSFAEAGTMDDWITQTEMIQPGQGYQLIGARK